MARYQVILAYDGARYSGFQRQSRSLTVQEVVEAALHELGWQGRAILAAGRTDVGVHARGQVIAFDLDWNHPPEALQAALNALLPPDVAAQAVQQAADDFHPRYDARWRTYAYHIYCQEQRDPLRERYAWRVWPAVSAEALNRPAADLTGRHDFAAFGTPPRAGGNTIRTISAAGWRSSPDPSGGEALVFQVTGDAFLYRMVRRMVSLQVAIAQGKLAPETIRRHLEQPPPHPAQGLAPSNGLVLLEVCYQT